MKKKLTIVYGYEQEKYAVYLQQLVSSLDDTDEGTIGIKDDSVEAAIWNEEKYRQNLPTISSNQRVIFIGDSKFIQSMRENMEEKYSNLGMHFGWLGNQGYMYVEERSLNADNLAEFASLCDKYGKSFQEELDLRFSPKKVLEAEDDMGLIPRAAEEKKRIIPRNAGGIRSTGIAAVKALAGRVKDTGQLVGQAGAKVVDLLKSDKALDQQYTLLTLILYMDGLGEFMGE